MEPFQRETILPQTSQLSRILCLTLFLLFCGQSMSQPLQEQSVYLESCALRHCIPYFGGDEVDGGVVEVEPLNQVTQSKHSKGTFE